MSNLIQASPNIECNDVSNMPLVNRAGGAFIVVRIMVLVVAWMCDYTATNETTPYYFFLITIMLSIYLLLEIGAMSITSLPRLLDPMVISSIMFFGLSHGAITNYFLWLDSNEFSFAFISRRLASEQAYGVTAMALVASCAVVTWQSYYSGFGVRLARLFQSFKHSHLLRGKISFQRLLIMVFVAFALRMLLYNVGLHGRGVSSDFFHSTKGFQAFSEIRRLDGLCMMVMAVTVLNYGREKSTSSMMLMAFSFVIEVLFGFLYGARSAIVFPFALAFVVRSYTLQRMSKEFLLGTVVAFLFAMTIGNEFKHYIIKHGFENVGVITKISRFLDERSVYRKYGASDNRLKTIETTSRNLGKNFELSAMVQYCYTGDRNRQANRVRKDLLVSPLLIASTRSIIGVPAVPWGLWFKDRVLRRNIGLKYSVGFSPIGFLLLGGGIPFVVLGAIVYGSMLRFTREILRHGDLGFLMFLALMSVLYMPNTVVSGLVVDAGRYLVFLPLIFAVLFREAK